MSFLTSLLMLCACCWWRLWRFCLCSGYRRMADEPRDGRPLTVRTIRVTTKVRLVPEFALQA